MNQKLDFTILKRLRKLHKATLKVLSDATGVSIQALTKLENNKTNPTVGTLASICSYFKIDVASFVMWAEIGHPLIFKTDIIENTIEEYVENFRINNLIVSNVKISAGVKDVKTKNHRMDYEICNVRKGKVKVVINGEEFIVEQGKVIYFDCLYDHEYEAIEDSEMTVIVIPKNLEEIVRKTYPFEDKKFMIAGNHLPKKRKKK
jgi:transcriptional regulator with XRE-family HTH domain